MPHPLATPVGVRRVVTAAIAAPSVHNTQPWRFRVRRPGTIDLHVDMDRLLHVIDPRGRAMHISCGAALFNLRLAIRVTGHRPLVRAFPDDPEEPTLLASVRAVDARLPSLTEAELYAVIPHRRTSRASFTERPVPRDVLVHLVNAANHEGAALSLLGPRASARVLSLVAAADDELVADADYRAELAHWTLDRASHDGVPSYAFGPRPTGRGVPLRDFGLGRPRSARLTDHFDTRPQLAALVTEGDDPEDWLRAGQALQRVLLTATRYGLSVSFLTQPLDVRDMHRHDDTHGHPLDRIQMIMRFGYGPAVPGTPRRPFPEFLPWTS